MELLLVAQKDKAPTAAKEYWTLARTAVDVMLHVPKSPKYLPKKVAAIGRELRQLESQSLVYQGAAASAEAVRLVETAERSIDAIMERWNIWKKGEALYPSYLLANQEATKRGVTIRRLLVLSEEQMRQDALVMDAIEVMEDQRRAGIKIYFAFRDELERSPAFGRFEEDYRKQGAPQDINAAMFDGEILIFSQSYGQVPLGMVGKPDADHDDQPAGNYLEGGAPTRSESGLPLRYDAVRIRLWRGFVISHAYRAIPERSTMKFPSEPFKIKVIEPIKRTTHDGARTLAPRGRIQSLPRSRGQCLCRSPHRQRHIRHE